jgi:hypothetical protein
VARVCRTLNQTSGAPCKKNIPFDVYPVMTFFHLHCTILCIMHYPREIFQLFESMQNKMRVDF